MNQNKLAQAQQQVADASAAFDRSKGFLAVALKSGDEALVTQMKAVVNEDKGKLTEARAELEFQSVAFFVERRIDHRLDDLRAQLDKSVKGQVHTVKEYVARRLDTVEMETELPMPQHEWRGTEIRFEQEPGVWGDWVDLEGPRGQNGLSGGGGALSTKRLELDGGGAFDSITGLDGGFAGTNLPGIPGVGGGGAASAFSAVTFNAGRAS